MRTTGVPYGGRAGYLVLTVTDDVLAPDWDGMVYSTIEDGREELQLAREMGAECILVECIRVPASVEASG